MVIYNFDDRSFQQYYDFAKQGRKGILEFDWFAVDSLNRLAMFETCGWGLIPKFTFDSQAWLMRLMEYIVTLPLGRKWTTDHPEAIGVEYNYLHEFGEKGIYVYSLREGSERDRAVAYQKIVVPEDPFVISPERSEFEAWLQRNRVPIPFHDQKKLRVEDFYRERV